MTRRPLTPREQREHSDAYLKMAAAAVGKVVPPGMLNNLPPMRVRTPSLEPTEHDEQSQVISWWATACNLYKLPPIVLMAIPNAQILMGSARHPERVMQYLRKEGFRVGAPDLFLAVPKRQFYAVTPQALEIHSPIAGLFIEMKRTKGGTLSVEQINFQAILRDQGYRCEVAFGAEAAITIIKEYLQ